MALPSKYRVFNLDFAYLGDPLVTVSAKAAANTRTLAYSYLGEPIGLASSEPSQPVKAVVYQVSAESLYQAIPNTKITQLALEGLYQATPQAVVSQAPIEVLWFEIPVFTQISQMGVEVLWDYLPKAIASQLATEVLWVRLPQAVVTQIRTEVLWRTPPHQARITQIVTEAVISAEPKAEVTSVSLEAAAKMSDAFAQTTQKVLEVLYRPTWAVASQVSVETLWKIPLHHKALITQHTVEVVGGTTAVAQVDQQSVEVLGGVQSTAIIIQTPAEVLGGADSVAMVGQEVAEVLGYRDEAFFGPTILDLVLTATAATPLQDGNNTPLLHLTGSDPSSPMVLSLYAWQTSEWKTILLRIPDLMKEDAVIPGPDNVEQLTITGLSSLQKLGMHGVFAGGYMWFPMYDSSGFGDHYLTKIDPTTLQATNYYLGQSSNSEMDYLTVDRAGNLWAVYLVPVPPWDLNLTMARIDMLNPPAILESRDMGIYQSLRVIFDDDGACYSYGNYEMRRYPPGGPLEVYTFTNPYNPMLIYDAVNHSIWLWWTGVASNNLVEWSITTKSVVNTFTIPQSTLGGGPFEYPGLVREVGDTHLHLVDAWQFKVVDPATGTVVKSQFLAASIAQILRHPNGWFYLVRDKQDSPTGTVVYRFKYTDVPDPTIGVGPDAAISQVLLEVSGGPCLGPVASSGGWVSTFVPTNFTGTMETLIEHDPLSVEIIEVLGSKLVVAKINQGPDTVCEVRPDGRLSPLWQVPESGGIWGLIISSTTELPHYLTPTTLYKLNGTVVLTVANPWPGKRVSLSDVYGYLFAVEYPDVGQPKTLKVHYFTQWYNQSVAPNIKTYEIDYTGYPTPGTEDFAIVIGLNSNTLNVLINNRVFVVTLTNYQNNPVVSVQVLPAIDGLPDNPTSRYWEDHSSQKQVGSDLVLRTIPTWDVVTERVLGTVLGAETTGTNTTQFQHWPQHTYSIFTAWGTTGTQPLKMVCFDFFTLGVWVSDVSIDVGGGVVQVTKTTHDVLGVLNPSGLVGILLIKDKTTGKVYAVKINPKEDHVAFFPFTWSTPPVPYGNFVQQAQGTKRNHYEIVSGDPNGYAWVLRTVAPQLNKIHVATGEIIGVATPALPTNLEGSAPTWSSVGHCVVDPTDPSVVWGIACFSTGTYRTALIKWDGAAATVYHLGLSGYTIVSFAVHGGAVWSPFSISGKWGVYKFDITTEVVTEYSTTRVEPFNNQIPTLVMDRVNGKVVVLDGADYNSDTKFIVVDIASGTVSGQTTIPGILDTLSGLPGGGFLLLTYHATTDEFKLGRYDFSGGTYVLGEVLKSTPWAYDAGYYPTRFMALGDGRIVETPESGYMLSWPAGEQFDVFDLSKIQINEVTIPGWVPKETYYLSDVVADDVHPFFSRVWGSPSSFVALSDSGIYAYQPDAQNEANNVALPVTWADDLPDSQELWGNLSSRVFKYGEYDFVGWDDGAYAQVIYGGKRMLLTHRRYTPSGVASDPSFYLCDPDTGVETFFATVNTPLSFNWILIHEAKEPVDYWWANVSNYWIRIDVATQTVAVIPYQGSLVFDRQNRPWSVPSSGNMFFKRLDPNDLTTVLETLAYGGPSYYEFDWPPTFTPNGDIYLTESNSAVRRLSSSGESVWNIPPADTPEFTAFYPERIYYSPNRGTLIVLGRGPTLTDPNWQNTVGVYEFTLNMVRVRTIGIGPCRWYVGSDYCEDDDSLWLTHYDINAEESPVVKWGDSGSWGATILSCWVCDDVIGGLYARGQYLDPNEGPFRYVCSVELNWGAFYRGVTALSKDRVLASAWAMDWAWGVPVVLDVTRNGPMNYPGQGTVVDICGPNLNLDQHVLEVLALSIPRANWIPGFTYTLGEDMS